MRHRKLRTGAAMRLLLALIVFFGLILATPTSGQVIAFRDVSPDSSTLDPVDPDGATGGRVNGTAVDPTTPLVLYAASEWGGIYKSTNGGANWFRLAFHFPLATWDVEVDPSNRNRIYATSFYDGRLPARSGINVSTNGGSIWTHPATAVPPASFCANPADQTELTAFGIGIDTTNTARVFIGTSCGLAMTTDSGVTWTFTSPVTGARRIWDVVVSADGRFVDTCGDDGHRFLEISTGSWSAGSGLPSGICSIAASPYSPGNANLFASVGTRIFETENGRDWNETRTNPSPQGRIPFVETNKRSLSPSGTRFDLWFGDVSLHSVTCDSMASGPNCGTGNTPTWGGPFTRSVGGHDDMGSILFNPTAANNACPILMSSDGGVYRNLETTHPGCQTPTWEQPSVSPHGLWPWALAGANRAGSTSEDLFFGNQDNGVFGTNNAGATDPTWENDACCDGFDTAADDAGIDLSGSVIYSVCCFGGRATRAFKKTLDFGAGAEINNYPAGGLLPGFRFPDSIVHWGNKKYAMVTRNCTVGSGGCPGADGGVFITQDADASPIVWTELGNATEPPSSQICGIKAATAGDVPTFYVQTGNCNADSTTDRMFRFTGTDPAGTWTEITLPQGGFGIFTVQETDPNHLLAAGFTATDAFMYRSTNGGANWASLPELDTMMRGFGSIPIKNERGPTNFTGMNGYHQPSLVAIDPSDPSFMVAGGRDSGIFVSTTRGTSWNRLNVISPNGSGHIPRPWHAYFDAEADGSKSVYISSQGRGVFRLTVSCANSSDDVFEASGSSSTDDTCYGKSLNPAPTSSQTHLHCDEDWVWFNATAGKTYVIETSNLVNGGSGRSDTTLALHGNCGQQLAFNDDGGAGFASRLEWTVSGSQTLDVRVRQFGEQYVIGEGYDITISEACLPNIFLVGQTVFGNVSFIADNSITTGPEFLVATGASATLTAGNSVILRNETAVVGELTVALTPSPCPGVPLQVLARAEEEAAAKEKPLP